MSARVFRTLWFALLLLAAAPAYAEEASRAEGDHFAVVVHFEAPELAREALTQVEQLWPIAAALYGLPQGARKDKLAVHLYRDTAGYEAAEQKLTGGAFKRNLAFAHFGSKSAHVALQPYVGDEALARIGLPYLTRSMLLHEAAHLVRYEAMNNFRSHPGWFYDGAAMWLKHHVLAGERVDEVALSAKLAVRVQALLEKDELPTVAQLLADDTGELAFYDRYAVRCLFFRFLQETHGKRLVRILKKTRGMGGGRDFTKRMSDVVRETLGKKRFAGLDDAFRAYVEKLKPAWDEPHRSLGPVEKDDGKADDDETYFVQCAFPKTNAVAWRTQPVGKSSYTFSATVEILPGAAQQMNVLLDLSDSGFLCIALSGGYGVTLFDYTSKDSNWNRVGAAKVPSVVTGKPFRVEVEVDGKRLDVSIDGASVLSAEFPKRTMEGPWGLGALAGTAGLWKAVRVK